ncbi:M48 family metallopeptidase [Natrarchaeobaculum sulfurireducens]|nr:M48 family metallopeptidase [Natrarchaeobaculum sulfurireducens]AXR79982.1 Zn-dependent protease with chaperone function [Natrarchaeobaculum sulfurireducens]
MQPLWMTFGLWLRMLIASLIAALGIATLLVIEFVMIAGVTVVFLTLAPWALAVCLLLVVPWLVVATAYRWVIPAPLVVGRLGHDPLSEAFELLARGIASPDTREVLRSSAVAFGLLVAWFIGFVFVETSSLTPFRAVAPLAVVAGVVGSLVLTGRLIADELGEGGSVQRRLEEEICVFERDELDADDTERLEDLQARLDRLANQAGVPAPTVRLGRERTPIAATVGVRPETSAIVLSRGLCEQLSDRELEGVLAHELAHVLNRDAAILTFLSIPRVKAHTMLETEQDGHRNPYHHPIVAIPIFVVAGLSRWVSTVVARYREYVADRSAVAITGDPAALASALETLDRDLKSRPSRDLREHRSTTVFSIVPPPWEEHPFFDRTRWFIVRRIFGTHPPTEKRIDRLRETD